MNGEVGVLDMYPTERGSWHLIHTLFELGYNPIVLHIGTIVQKNQSLLKLVLRSRIKKWIFSGSPQSVHNIKSNQIPLDVFKLKDREFLLICYSMESVLNQLGVAVNERYENRKEHFNLYIQKTKAFIFNKEYLFNGVKNPMIGWRNHIGYTPASSDELKGITELASYRGELMIAFYNNILFMQFHPERTKDGKRFIGNWLQGS